MPTVYSVRPKLKKGGLVVYESVKAAVGKKPLRIIDFQFNPDQIKRTLAIRSPQSKPSNAGGAKEDVTKAQGPPVETITLTVSLTAEDQLATAKRNDTVAKAGIYPVLSVLEMLLYPTASTADKIANEAQQGKAQLSPKDQDLPLVLLVWEKSRVVPVQITSFSVTEEAFDENLNPIQAKVDLSLKVLTYMEFPKRNLAQDTFLAYQREKERLAGLYTPNADAETNIRGLLPGS